MKWTITKPWIIERTWIHFGARIERSVQAALSGSIIFSTSYFRVDNFSLGGTQIGFFMSQYADSPPSRFDNDFRVKMPTEVKIKELGANDYLQKQMFGHEERKLEFWVAK